MLKTLLILLMGVFYSSSVYAEPKVDNYQIIQTKKQVKKNKKKKSVVVNQNKNPFLRCEGFNCDMQPKKYDKFTHDKTTAELTAAEFFRQDKIVTRLLMYPFELPDEIKQKNDEGKRQVVVEAKKWEGKTARKDRRELRELFADVDMPIDPTHIPWCAAFANAILNRSGYETTKSLMARSFLHWGTKTKNPEEGDIVVLKRGRNGATGHVGFFQGYEWVNGVQYVKVLGGNTDHAVQIGYFPVSAVLGYRTAIA